MVTYIISGQRKYCAVHVHIYTCMLYMYYTCTCACSLFEFSVQTLEFIANMKEGEKVLIFTGRKIT